MIMRLLDEDEKAKMAAGAILMRRLVSVLEITK